MQNESTLLSIAGSDPSGGAGIQADLKTMTMIGVYGATAITCITVQNARGVQSMYPLDPVLVQQQIQAVLDDHIVSHIKIGMLGNSDCIRMVSELLDDFQGEVVLDPVLTASSGGTFITEKSLACIKTNLLPKITYLTPNRHKLGALTGRTVQTDSEGIECAKSLLNDYPSIKGVVVKGGHFGEETSIITDYLILQKGTQEKSTRQRIPNNNLHGTGCTFASAFSSYLLLDNSVGKAFQKAGVFMENVILAGKTKQISKSASNGPLLHYLTTFTP